MKKKWETPKLFNLDSSATKTGTSYSPHNEGLHTGSYTLCTICIS